jgi:Pyridoxamine 5'-phosphate oxidase
MTTLAIAPSLTMSYRLVGPRQDALSAARAARRSVAVPSHVRGLLSCMRGMAASSGWLTPRIRTVVFRTAVGSPLGEDLRTGIADAEYKVAFEIDHIDPAARTGWSVMIQGAAHHVDDEQELADVRSAGVEPWAGGEREHFVRIKPTLISGRRIRHA